MSRQRLKLLAWLAIIALLISCSTQKPSKETSEAISALRKIQAATQVGVSYQQYGQLLIEAKAKTNDAIRSLPEGSLKTELTGAMDAYADAATVWAIKIKDRDLYDRPELDQNLIAKYRIPVSGPKSFGDPPTASPDKALQIIWLRADTYLDQISKVVGQ